MQMQRTSVLPGSGGSLAVGATTGWLSIPLNWMDRPLKTSMRVERWVAWLAKDTDIPGRLSAEAQAKLANGKTSPKVPNARKAR